MIKLIKQAFLRVVIYSTLSLSPSITLASQPADDDEKPDLSRWFEIEVILYKATTEQGLENESWDTDTSMVLPVDLIDFLQPFGLPEDLAVNESDRHSITNPVNNEAAELDQFKSERSLTEDHSSTENIDQQLGNNTNITLNESETSDLETVEETPEQPFVLLEKDFLQLQPEAQNIARHVNYDLLAHFSWRQPVLSKKQATSLRIAGGYDYQALFDYSGEKKLEAFSAEDGLSIIENNETNNEGGINESLTTPIEASESEQITNGQSQILSQKELSNSHLESAELNSGEAQAFTSDGLEQKLIPLPWVPEVDGSILVYIHRNYLHVDTDLFYRRPDNQEIDIYDFQNQLPPLQVDENIKLSQESIIDIAQKPPLENNFNWQYDGNFLSDDDQKTYTERLFNYPLKQNRRLRSNQLNYFDHPLIGMLVIIRPYEIESSEDLNQADELTSNE